MTSSDIGVYVVQINPPTIFKEVYHILLFLDEAWHMRTSVVHWSLKLSLSCKVSWFGFSCQTPYFIASKLHHRLLFLLLLPICAPPGLPQLKTAQFSTSPWGQHTSMREEPRDRDHFAV